MEYFWNHHGECHSVLLPTPEPMMKEDEKLKELPMAVVLEPNGEQGQQQPDSNLVLITDIDDDDGDEEVKFDIEPIIDQNIKIIPDVQTPNTSNEKKKKTWTSFVLRTAVGIVPVAGPAINATLSFMDGDYVGTVLNLGFAVADVYTLGLVGSASKLLESAAQKALSEQATNIGVKYAADAAVSEAAKQATVAAANAAATQLAWETASKTLAAHAGKKVKKKFLKGLLASVASTYNAYAAAYQTAAAVANKAAEVALKAGNDVIVQNGVAAVAQNGVAMAGQALTQAVATAAVETSAKAAATTVLSMRSTETKDDDTVN